ncbi:MAG TPA: OmpA family protein [Blastocatellia bacterium]|nr:OmpA family protein [Blastocatellia bacterium]
MKSRALLNLMFVAIVALGVAVPAIAQDQAQASQAGAAAQAPAAQPSRVAVGRKQKISGVVISREADKMVVRDINGSDVAVTVSGATKISEKKANPFRSAKNYPVTALLRGLEVEVEGRGDSSGVLVADRIKFTDDDFGVARSLDSRVAPVETRVTTTEGRVDTAENRITAAEQNAQRLSGQLEELAAVANTARGGAKAAQETADQALAASKANSADIQATNDRISAIDNYEAKQNITVNFKVNSAVLSDEAKMALDEIATQAKAEKGYLIQVTGFASADGPEAKNRVLSERRADAVKRYLAEHDIPLHRMINPFGFGELKPVAENNTREGRKQNRRVEVAILVNKGLTASR